MKYPQATEDVQESKLVTRTIKYVDKANETKEVATPVTQSVNLTRTNKRNKVAKVVTAGDWSTGTWGFSRLSNCNQLCDALDKATVAEATVNINNYRYNRSSEIPTKLQKMLKRKQNCYPYHQVSIKPTEQKKWLIQLRKQLN